MNTNTHTNLVIGQTYLTTSGFSVIPLKQQGYDRALFVAEEFQPTPFVSWTYQIKDDNTISLYRGNYYRTLAEAMNETDPEPMPITALAPPTFRITFYCPDCETLHRRDFSDYDSVQELVERVSDYRVRCPECGDMWMGITDITVLDESAEYSFPIWTGPVTTHDNDDDDEETYQ